MRARCPICEAELPADLDPKLRPFCSARCRLVDLDRWLSGDYRIPGPAVPPHEGGSKDTETTDPTES
jgi:endogenous inhibitor of DNA gyrase (YacG/DUF329 family)